MPNIKISHLETKYVKRLSQQHTEQLANLIECPLDWLTFCVQSVENVSLFCEGKPIHDTVSVHVEWFDRGQDIKQKVATYLTKAILSLNETEKHQIEYVNIIFVDLKKSDFFENGTSF